ncbi:hypothetical protein [Jannaschia sp. LMIT008]|uniref:hypothetical protein n=1 Tax=Jannaschia maritima TaxID=3032585 RepID=UPI00281275BE|nr:hypothetical protein [Jannaschia sp. LMIT008]
MTLRLSSEFFRAAEQRAAAAWDREVAIELVALHPRHMAALGVSEDEVVAFVRGVRDYAVGYGVTGRRETFRVVVVALALGLHFPHDPRLADAVAYALGRKAIPEARRTAMLGDMAEAWLGATWDGRGLAERGAALVDRVRGHARGPTDRDGMSDALGGLVPQSPTVATPARRRAFLDAVLAQAEGYGLRTAGQRLAYAGGALLHGVYWFDDPLFGHLRGMVEGAATPGDLCDAMGAFYARFGDASAEVADGS